MDHYDALQNVTSFLLRETGSVWGHWSGHMPAADQRKLFGVFLGKGKVHVDGLEEKVTHTVKVCFGTDFAETASLDLKTGELRRAAK